MLLKLGLFSDPLQDLCKHSTPQSDVENIKFKIALVCINIISALNEPCSTLLQNDWARPCCLLCSAPFCLRHLHPIGPLFAAGSNRKAAIHALNHTFWPDFNHQWSKLFRGFCYLQHSQSSLWSKFVHLPGPEALCSTPKINVRLCFVPKSSTQLSLHEIQSPGEICRATFPSPSQMVHLEIDWYWFTLKTQVIRLSEFLLKIHLDVTCDDISHTTLSWCEYHRGR